MPFYNEAAILGDSIAAFSATLANLKAQKLVAQNSFLILVNDGSADGSAQIAKGQIDGRQIAKTQSTNAAQQGAITLLSLAKNYGHQNALLAGLHFAAGKCDCALSIDCDLEQDLGKIPEFLAAYRRGCDVVFGVRRDRSGDSLFKRFSARGFYALMRILGAKIIPNHADYRLLSAKALTHLTQFSEVNLFLRAICLELGLRREIVHFELQKSAKKQSKYTLKKMLSLALSGVTSFSLTPLRIIFALGFCISIVSAILGLYGVVVALLGRGVSGWGSIVVPIYFLGGVQMLALGVIGEYIGRIYAETKRRPRYLIDEIYEES